MSLPLASVSLWQNSFGQALLPLKSQSLGVGLSQDLLEDTAERGRKGSPVCVGGIESEGRNG